MTDGEGIGTYVGIEGSVPASEESSMHKVYVAGVGPFTALKTDVYPDDGSPMSAIRATQIRVLDAPTRDDHVVRYADLIAEAEEAIQDPLEVADISDPSAELSGVSGTTEGTIRYVHEGAASNGYRWTAALLTADAPYVCPGLTGSWVAGGPLYSLQTGNFSGGLHSGAGALIDGGLSVGLDAAISGRLSADEIDVAGIASFNNAVNVLGAGYFAGALSVAGAAVFSSSLAMNGKISSGKAGVPGVLALHTGTAMLDALQGGADGLHVIGSKVWLGGALATANAVSLAFNAGSSQMDLAFGAGVTAGLNVGGALSVDGDIRCDGDMIRNSTGEAALAFDLAASAVKSTETFQSEIGFRGPRIAGLALADFDISDNGLTSRIKVYDSAGANAGVVLIGAKTRFGGVLQSSDGATALTLTAGAVAVAGALTLTGNLVKSSAGTTAITLSGADAVVAGDLTVGGNDIKSSTAVALSLSGANVDVAGNLKLVGNTLKSSTDATAVTLSGADALFAGDVTIGGGDIKGPSGIASMGIASNGDVTFAGDVIVAGGDIKSAAGTAALSVSGTSATALGNLTVKGDLSIEGATVLKNLSLEALAGSDLLTVSKVKLTGNVIQSSATPSVDTLTLSDSDLAVAGDLTVGGNDIYSSTAKALALAGEDVTVLGDLTVTGNDIKSSANTALTLSGADVTVAGDLTVGGNDIYSSTAKALTLSGANLTAQGNLALTGNLLAPSGAVILEQDLTMLLSEFGLDLDGPLRTAHIMPQTSADLNICDNNGTTRIAVFDFAGASSGIIEFNGKTRFDDVLQSSAGTTALALTGADVTVAGDLTVTGNDIKSSTATALTLSGADVAVVGDLQVGGNDVKSSTGVVAITLSDDDVAVPGNLTPSGELSGTRRGYLFSHAAEVVIETGTPFTLPAGNGEVPYSVTRPLKGLIQARSGCVSAFSLTIDVTEDSDATDFMVQIFAIPYSGSPFSRLLLQIPLEYGTVRGDDKRFYAVLPRSLATPDIGETTFLAGESIQAGLTVATGSIKVAKIIGEIELTYAS